MTINWRCYFDAVPKLNTYAKDAKVQPPSLQRAPFADMHTNFESEEPPSLEQVLRGHAIELWSDALGERFWLVADEADAAKLGEPRGATYTAAEARRIVKLADTAVVAEIHRWKRQFDAVVRE